MGKTHFAENTLQDVFEQMNLDVTTNLHIIQNDLVRKACLDKWLKANPKKSKSDGIKATASESISMFKNQLSQTLLKLSKNKSDDIQMIYLDKNYPPAEIKITLEAINEHAANKNASIRRVALVPHIAKNDCPDFPFSMNFLVQCFIRCLVREDHLTIQNDDPERLAKILVLFFQQFKGTQFNDSFTQELGFDNLIKVRFTLEHEDLELPNKLKKALRQVINSQSVAEVDETQIQEVVRLITLYCSLFGGAYTTPCTSENQQLLKTSLTGFGTDFKHQVASAKAANQEAQI